MTLGVSWVFYEGCRLYGRIPVSYAINSSTQPLGRGFGVFFTYICAVDSASQKATCMREAHAETTTHLFGEQRTRTATCTATDTYLER